MARVRYRGKPLWKRLFKYLNNKKSHNTADLYKEFESYCTYYVKRKNDDVSVPVCDFVELSEILNLLTTYKFCKRYKVRNQNGKEVAKILMNRKIPKKLTLETLRSFSEHSWLFWFMFPENTH